MKYTLLLSLLAAGMILSGCQSDSADTTPKSTASGQNSGAAAGSDENTAQTENTPNDENGNSAQNGDTGEDTQTGEVTDNDSGSTAQGGDNTATGEAVEETTPADDDGDSAQNGDDNAADEAGEDTADEEEGDSAQTDEDESASGSSTIYHNPGYSSVVPEPTAEQKRADGWYMRTVATAITPDGKRYVHRTAGIFGELKESSDEQDRHDIKAFGKATLYVVFAKINNNTIEDYFSDYHHYDPEDLYNGERAMWTFQVKNEANEDLTHAAIKLEIEGPYRVYKKAGGRGYEEVLSKHDDMLKALSLIDLDTHLVYTYDALKNANLNMDGKKVRTFRWVLGNVLVEHFDGSDIQALVSRKQLVRNAKAVEGKGEQSGGKFGLPPSP